MLYFMSLLRRIEIFTELLRFYSLVASLDATAIGFAAKPYLLALRSNVSDSK